MTPRTTTLRTPVTIPGPQGALAVVSARVGRGPAAVSAAARLPLVFLHADAGRASQWAPVLDRLRDDRARVAFDFRGHGDSAPAADGDYSFAGRAADVGASADAFGFERFVVAAHSGGAAVALAYAAWHPERVAGLLLVDPATDPRALPAEVRDGMVRDAAGPDGLAAVQRYYATLAGDEPAVRDRVLADVAATAPAARAGVVAALAAWDPEPTLRGYRGPASVLASPITDGQRTLYRLRPDLAHAVVPDVGHWVQLERPADVAAAITELARTAERAAASATASGPR